MKLDYGAQLNPEPIMLSVGSLRKPKLIEIANLNFDKFDLYEMFIKMTPELFYTKIKGNDGKAYWDSLSDDEQYNMTLYDLILDDTSLQRTYEKILNFFFVETVVFREGLFILFNNVEDASDVSLDDVCGVLHKEAFLQIIDLIQQICCIHTDEEIPEDMKFKNRLARKLYEKMKKAEKEEKEKRKMDINLSIPNIISAVSNKHPSISPFSVWNLTIFQLLDSFSRLQQNTMFGIDCTRVSVWGDEKKTFNAALWYKNGYDK